MADKVIILDLYEANKIANYDAFIAKHRPDGVVVRLTLGEDYVDKLALTHITEFSKRSVPVGCYVVYVPTKTIDGHMRNIKGALPKDLASKLKLGIWLDAEIDMNFTNYYLMTYVRMLAIALSLEYACKISIYTGLWWWDDNMRDPKDGSPVMWINEYPFILAQYPLKTDPDEYITLLQIETKYNALMANGPRLLTGLKNWCMWQWSGDRFHLEGCESTVDVNIFNGTLEEYRKFFAIDQEPLEVRVARLEADMRVVKEKLGLA